MSSQTITIKYPEKGYINTARNCHLCGEAFVIGMLDCDTICPKCKKLWQTIIKERGTGGEL